MDKNAIEYTKNILKIKALIYSWMYQMWHELIDLPFHYFTNPFANFCN